MAVDSTGLVDAPMGCWSKSTEGWPQLSRMRTDVIQLFPPADELLTPGSPAAIRADSVALTEPYPLPPLLLEYIEATIRMSARTSCDVDHRNTPVYQIHEATAVPPKRENI